MLIHELTIGIDFKAQEFDAAQSNMARELARNVVIRVISLAMFDWAALNSWALKSMSTVNS